ncbi:MAG: serine/threonine protein kinase [Blastocatellia bacterium]|nr:serine/threonine protein kinase [Blastocatellia bacterium]
MNTDNWPRVKEVLHEALEIEPADRPRFLNELGLSPEIRSEVESLLSMEHGAAAMMDGSAVEFSKDFIDGADGGMVGKRIGAYRINGELGHGGMGAVYLAERADGKFEQKVALKLLRREMNTGALRRHFEQEREILASLDHPNIARLLNAGTTDEGIPFIAMEFVDGLPIDEYSNVNEIGLKARLELFRVVCSAVEFAHRNLVVHRDLKPSNILVTNDGIPKLLDFGISKILSKEFDSADSATITRMGVMTPSYASPEQLKRSSVTTLSDVYSLGVILYELLSGNRPFGSSESDIREIYNAVLENDPVPPSDMLAMKTRQFGMLASAPTVVRPDDAGLVDQARTNPGLGRHTGPGRFVLSSNTIRGDLDNIVLKALRKEPERRYGSVASFSEDIERYLKGLPVNARPNTLSYRATKFVARNRLRVGGAAILTTAMAGGVAATVWQGRIATAEKAKAERRFNDVRSLANSFLFEFGPMIENIPGTTAAQELLVKRALEYLDRLASESENDPGLQRELASAYEKVGDVQGNPYSPNIGDVKGALLSYEKSRSIRASMFERTPEDLQLAGELATIHKLIADVDSHGGDYDKAVGNYDKALEIREMIVARSPQDFAARAKLAEVLRSRGLIPFFEGDNKKAIEYYSRARDILEVLHREDPANLAIEHEFAFIFVSIGEAQGWDGELKLAGENLQKGLDMLLSVAGRAPDDRKVNRSLMLAYNKRAENHVDVEEFRKGVELYSKGVEIAERLYRADQKSFQAKRDVAMGYKKLAQALDSAGESKRSLEMLTRSMNTFNELSSADTNNAEALYDVANTRFSVGETYLSLKDFDSALEAFRTANDEFGKVLSINPENIYAVRMSTFNLERMGRAYQALAAKRDRTAMLNNALENFRAAHANLNKMKADGNLGDIDLPAIAETEGKIKAIESLLR